jgi:hypothetical protein
LHYTLAVCAPALNFAASHADAQLVIFPRGAISFTDLIAPTIFPEPALLALLGTRLIVHI